MRARRNLSILEASKNGAGEAFYDAGSALESQVEMVAGNGRSAIESQPS